MLGKRPYVVSEYARQSRGVPGRVHNQRRVYASSKREAKAVYARLYRQYPTSVLKVEKEK
jgi:hypothetical protein